MCEPDPQLMYKTIKSSKDVNFTNMATPKITLSIYRGGD